MQKSVIRLTIVLFLLFLLLMSIVAYAIAFTLIKNGNIEQMLSYSPFLGEMIMRSPKIDEYSDIVNYMEKKAEQLALRITIIHENGAVVFESDYESGKMENHLDRKEVIQAIEIGKAYDIRLSSTLRIKYLYTAYKFNIDSNESIIIRLSKPLKNISAQTKLIAFKIVLGSFLFLTLAFFVLLLHLRSFFISLDTIKKVLEKALNGDFNQRILTKNPSIVQNITNLINSLIEKGHETTNENREYLKELKAVLDSLTEGIIVLNSDGIIHYANPVFFSITKRNENKNDKINSFYWEIIRNPILQNHIRLLLEKRIHFTEEVYINNEIYQCSGYYIDEIKKGFIVLSDVTSSRSIDNMQKGLITAVSHELRTPLAIIKGYLESIGDDEKQNKKIVAVITKNTERLIHIVNDLIVLYEADEKRKIISYEKFDIMTLISAIQDFFTKESFKKNLYIKIKSEKKSLIIEADQYKLQQVFINLMDNAIHYTENGGVTIHLDDAHEKSVTIRFEDTGIGIDKINILKVFDKFYTVDKARSRKHGGTGLGLAIVKDIIEAHNGTITINSTFGVGTTVTIKIPQKKPED